MLPQDSAPIASPKPVIRPQLPSQFQRFVQESTGKLLPIYGSDFFESQQSTADSTLPVPAEYILGVGDEVRVQIWGAVDYSGSHTIDRNGQISIPKVGTFSLIGLPVQDLDRALRSQVGKVFTNFQLSATLGRLKSIQVYVVGQVRAPGPHKVPGMGTVVNALFASGGPANSGSMRNIQVKRAGRLIAVFDLYDLISKGDKGQDIALQAGDVIVVPPVGPRVAVTGALDQAAIYELKATGTTVAEVLSSGGGVPTLAQTQKALLERIDASQTPPRQVQELSLQGDGSKYALRDGDLLTLLPISQAFGNAVTLQGAVAEPLRYRWAAGMRVSDLIPEREALITAAYYKKKNLLVQNIGPDSRNPESSRAGSKTLSRIGATDEQINWDYAVVERLDKGQLVSRLIPFNLKKAVVDKDPANNLELLAGDVVTILSHNDLRLPQEKQSRMVRVEGEVPAPGVYQALPGETMPQLLRRIGGITAHAYVFGIEFSRESVRQRQQENIEALIRRLESQAQAQISATAANSKSPEAVAQAQLVLQQQQAQLKAQIERLKTLRSNGRMALELNTAAATLAALPSVVLEEGDRIVVPATPSHVSAFGSVNNENVFLYRPGKTVGEIVKSAGLTEDAEPDQAFVLRADGSIVARRDRSGFFGGGFESVVVMPGDTLVVPAQIDRESRYNFTVRALKDWTQILSNLGLGLAAIRTLRN
ncbi:MAG: polysaccharide biosynthesis/export family protein [Rhodoferax sp.]|uniref:polysaccharide biosynthesis/export family protein n=1 Tax=Rhodoferax sp. TaxID=50421 RepID=UPI002ACDD675|nr:polysaccharide biosynthesis/export family protein [Rhodoferax sp.]MDZ7892202.1 polysaccharide biosynthesis/export family protein [Rhodoferax sp.]